MTRICFPDVLGGCKDKIHVLLSKVFKKLALNVDIPRNLDPDYFPVLI